MFVWNFKFIYGVLVTLSQVRIGEGRGEDGQGNTQGAILKVYWVLFKVPWLNSPTWKTTPRMVSRETPTCVPTYY